ncbi:MAG: TadE/TadG family type IV pilus assembly protein [Sneathiella sp.]
MLLQKRYKHIISKFGRNEKGTTAVELALISPILVTVLFGIIELSVAMFVNTVVEGGLRDASRVGLTGLEVDEGSREQAIVDIVNGASLGMVSLTTSDVSSKIYPSFGDIGMPEPYIDDDGDGSYTDGETFEDINGNGAWDSDMGEAGLGGPGEIVLYSISYNWNFLSGQMIPILNGVIPMTASMVVRNEPF